MKSLLSLLISITLLGDTLPEDKKYHTLAGTGIYLGCLFISGIAKNNNIYWLDPLTCLVPVYVAAIGKEVYDHHNNGTAEFADAAVTTFVPTTGYVIYKFSSR